MKIWIDVEDLFSYAAHHARPTGIQRMSGEIAAALLDTLGDRVGFLRHDRGPDGFRILPAAAVLDLYARMAEAPAGAPRGPLATAPAMGSRRHAGWLPREIRQPLGRAWRAQADALRAGAEALGALPALLRAKPPATQGAPLAGVLSPGDVLAALGSPWSEPGQPGRMARAAARGGARMAMLVCDMIPLERPEFCDAAQVAAFARHMREALPVADTTFAISRATAAAVTGWAAREAIALRAPPFVLPLGHRPLPAPSDLPEGLAAGNFVLMVGTLEARKNHWLAFRAWRRLIDEMPRGQVPPLVFAGRRGWMVDDLMRALDNCAWLDGAIRWVREPDDATLSALYRACRFSLFPSHVEGWGLPVVEGLAAGRPCFATGHGAVAEAADGFATPIDPDDVTGACGKLRRALECPADIEAAAARIAREFRPPSWTATAEAIVGRLAGRA